MDRDEDLEWTWERAIAALRKLHDSPHRWGWRYTMHSLGFAEGQNETMERLTRQAERERRWGKLRPVPSKEPK